MGSGGEPAPSRDCPGQTVPGAGQAGAHPHLSQRVQQRCASCARWIPGILPFWLLYVRMTNGEIHRYLQFQRVRQGCLDQRGRRHVSGSDLRPGDGGQRRADPGVRLLLAVPAEIMFKREKSPCLFSFHVHMNGKQYRVILLLCYSGLPFCSLLRKEAMGPGVSLSRDLRVQLLDPSCDHIDQNRSESHQNKHQNDHSEVQGTKEQKILEDYSRRKKDKLHSIYNHSSCIGSKARIPFSARPYSSILLQEHRRYSAYHWNDKHSGRQASPRTHRT